jgi:hypothetical protein
MKIAHHDLEKCQSYVIHHLTGDHQPLHTASRGMPFITISRQAGAGGRTFGTFLQNNLDDQCPLPKGNWTLFDRSLVKKAMEEHGVHQRFARYLPEARISELSGIIGELVGLHPPIWELHQHLYGTLLHLANIGGVILVGRGANVVTRKLKRGLHLRLVGSAEKRAERAADFYSMPLVQARSFIQHEDKARRLWVKDNFNEDIDDPCGYDLVINSDNLTLDDMAALVSQFLISKMPVEEITA